MQQVIINKQPFNYYEKLVSNLTKGKVLVVGDLMLDTYLIGDSSRISPEAPVPVVKIEETKQVLGGAGNVARSIVALGGKVSIFGTVGEDKAAQEMKDIFDEHNIQSYLCAIPNRPTTIKTRVLARGQQMLRMDMETSEPLSKDESKKVCDLLATTLEDFEVVIVSDYAKGVVTQDVVDFLLTFRNKEGRQLKIFADPKPDNKHLYKNTFLLTPNLKETAELLNKNLDTIEKVEEFAPLLLKELNINYLLSTLGAHGMALFAENEPIWHIPTKAKQVFDVTGAGDTVIATLALAISSGISVLDACVLANYAAGIVVGKVGSATANPEEMLVAIKKDFDILAQ